MNRSSASSIAAATCVLSAIPYPAAANHGLSAIGDIIDGIVKFALGTAAFSLLLALLNLSARETWLRVLCIALLLPYAAVSFICLLTWPQGGIPALLALLSLGWLIRKSIPKEWNPEDEGAGMP